MTPESIILLGKEALEVTVAISAIMLLPALAVGLLVSMFQAATQINEATLSFIPKLLITFIAIIVGGPWMLRTMITYTERLFTGIPGLIG